MGFGRRRLSDGRFLSLLFTALAFVLMVNFSYWCLEQWEKKRNRKFKEANPRGLVVISLGNFHGALVRVQYGLTGIDEPLDDDWKIIGADSEEELAEKIDAWVAQSRARRGV